MNKREELDETLTIAWVTLASSLKNSRITQGMTYNEAIIMLVAYQQYQKDGTGTVSFKEIGQRTKMLKSLVNRTVASLEKKGFLERSSGEDRRTAYITPVKDKLDEYLAIHAKSLELAHNIVELIGEEDAKAFLRISNAITEADPLS